MIGFGVECFECMAKSPSKLFQSLDIDEELQHRIYFRIFERFGELSDMDELPPSAIVSPEILYQSFIEVLDNDHPLREINKRTNDMALEYVDQVNSVIYESSDPLHTALITSTMGNIFDFATLSEEDSKEKFGSMVNNELRERKFDLLENYDHFLELLETGNQLLYCGDNNGEIVFDKVLIQFLRESYGWEDKKIYYGVKGQPALNDVLEEDAKYVGLNELCDEVIPASKRGYQGIYLDDSTERFKDIFYSSDIVICKGMGNFETLAFENEINGLFFMFMVKCVIHERLLDLPYGSLVFTPPLSK